MGAAGAALAAAAKLLAKAASSWKLRLAGWASRLTRWVFALIVAIGASFMGILVVIIIVVTVPVAALFGGAESVLGSDGSCGASTASARDPIDLPALEIATRIYQVGEDMGMGRREILTAFTVALVESGGGMTMINVDGGHATSTGVFQQQDLQEWTQGENDEPRNRNNVADAARTFFEHLDDYDTGQSVGELAADIQRPQEDLRYKYADALPRAEEFYTRVEAELEAGGADAEPIGALAPVSGCSGASTSPADWEGTGPASLGTAETLYEPKRLAEIPSQYTWGGTEMIDARLLDDAIFLAEEYDLQIIQGWGHQGNGSPSVSHAYGTALDMGPANTGSLDEWRRTAERLARDLGWRPDCAALGKRPECALAPAIRQVAYNGFTDGNHGDPAHTGNPHIHISFECSCGPYDGVDRGRSDWIKSFVMAVAA